MKKSLIIPSLLAGLLTINAACVHAQPNLSNRTVQVAILFDTSNSMDGLIDQAKARIWGIINEVNTLRYNGQVPRIEIALYEYGTSGLAFWNLLRTLTMYRKNSLPSAPMVETNSAEQ